MYWGTYLAILIYVVVVLVSAYMGLREGDRGE